METAVKHSKLVLHASLKKVSVHVHALSHTHTHTTIATVFTYATLKFTYSYLCCILLSFTEMLKWFVDTKTVGAVLQKPLSCLKGRWKSTLKIYPMLF